MKNNKLDNFESFINSKVAEEEVAYNPNDWNDLQQRLDATTSTPFYKKGWFIGGAAAVVIGAASLLIDKPEEKTIKKQPQIVNKVIAQKKISENVILENDFKAKNKELSKIEAPTNVSKIKIKKIKSETKIKEEESTKSLTNHQNQPKETVLSSSLAEEIIVKEEKNEVIKKPNAAFTTQGKLTGCGDLAVVFEAEDQKDVNYLWSFGDGIYSDLKTVTHTFEKPGTYQVELIVQSSLDQSILTKSNYKEEVTVFESPKITILENKYLKKGITTIDFSFVGDKVNQIKWNLGKETKLNSSEVTQQYKKKGVYLVELEAYSIEGCKTKTANTIFIEKDYNLLAPTAFTPNGDGLNDFFLPEALKSTSNPFTMIVQSRTSGVVFETSSSSNLWDGKNYKTGTLCKEGGYVWVVKLKNDKGEIEEYKGVVLITNVDR